jgi:hypothetical protein
MIAHETPAAPDAVPNLLKVSESAFCVGLRPRRPDMLVPRSQIEQTAAGTSTLILVFEAPSI